MSLANLVHARAGDNRSFSKYLLCMFVGFLLSVSSGVVLAADATMNEEIDFLIAAVAESDCIFVRNGKEHTAEDATDHLQMKRKRGKRYYRTSEEFIERIASKSSWSGKAYMIRCEDQPAQTAEHWFTLRLEAFRAQAVSSGER